MESVGALLPVHCAAGIRPPPQSNMPIKGNALKTSFQHLELIYEAMHGTLYCYCSDFYKTECVISYQAVLFPFPKTKVENTVYLQCTYRGNGLLGTGTIYYYLYHFE